MSIQKFNRGDTPTFRFTASSGGTPVDITGASVKFTMKQSPDLPDNSGLPEVLGPLVCTVTDGPSGIAEVTLTTADSAQLDPRQYGWDCQMVLGSGTVFSVIGSVQVVADYTLDNT